MFKYRKNISLFFVGIILLMMSIECMPHVFDAHGSRAMASSVPAYHNVHQATDNGMFHALYDFVAALSETHAHNQHEHNIIVDKVVGSVNPHWVFVFLLISFIAFECLLFIERRKPHYEDIPILYKNYTPSAWALRGPPSLL